TIGINQIDTTQVLASLATLAVWPYLATALLALLLFFWIEQRTPDPIIRPQLLATRQLVLANLLSMGAGLGEAAVVFLPTLAVLAFGVGESTASFLLLPVVLAVSVGSPLGGRLLNPLGSRTIIVAGTT